MQKWKTRLVNWLLPKLLCSVNPYQVIRIDDRLKKAFINGKELTKEEIKTLKYEIYILKQSRLWNIYTNTIAEQAKKVMFEKSTSFEDMYAGKMMLYNLDVLQKIANIIQEYKV